MALITIESDADGYGCEAPNYRPVGDFIEGTEYFTIEETRFGCQTRPIIQVSRRPNGTQEQDYLYQADGGARIELRDGETCAQAVIRWMAGYGIKAIVRE